MTALLSERVFSNHFSSFLHYLATRFTDGERLPSLSSISLELGISLAALREQLEVARALGVVEVRPKTGVRRLSYAFKPAVVNSLNYAVLVDGQNFVRFAELRNHIESAYWYQAVALLTVEDYCELDAYLNRAEEKLRSFPPQIPHAEHRELHLSIYKRLENPFVSGILEAYWDLYEAVGLAVYTDFEYLTKVWRYHRKMVEYLRAGEPEKGYQALIEHADLLLVRTRPTPRRSFE